MTSPGAVRRWRPAFPLDLWAVLAPLRRGRGDPAFQRVGEVYWLTGNTLGGPATVALGAHGNEIHARAWGEGADAVLDGLPALLGGEDDDAGFHPHHPVVGEMRRRVPGLRLGATRRVWDSLVPAVLEQKVTGYEARRSWRELCRRFGEPAPGPAGAAGSLRLRVPPGPAAILAIPDWEWHRAGVDGARRRTLIAAAGVAHRLERAAELRGAAGRELLRRVPGIGVWTAAEVAQRAWGDPDAVSVGDLHIPGIVGQALTGTAVDDAGMLEILAPYAPQRQRVVRYVEATVGPRPRFAPRFPVRDYRSI